MKIRTFQTSSGRYFTLLTEGLKLTRVSYAWLLTVGTYEIKQSTVEQQRLHRHITKKKER